MRDIIWTLIIIWLIYKVVAIFKGNSAAKSTAQAESDQPTGKHSAMNEKDNKSALKKHLNNDGEYVDYEEIK